MASQDDRKALSSLHGIGSTTKKPVPWSSTPNWTKEPTLIPIPRNPPPFASNHSRSVVYNPYDRIGQSNSTNPTASKTLLSGKPKPRKTVRDGVAMTHSPLSSISSSSKGKGKALDKPAKFTRDVSLEIIDVDADHASTDELNLIVEHPVISTYFKPISPPKRTSPHKPVLPPDPTLSPRNPAPPTKDWPLSSPRLVKDGKYTNELMARHGQKHLRQRSSSPIDSFTDDDIVIQTQRIDVREKPTSVREKVARIEALNKEFPGHIPALPVRSFKKTTIKQKMQPKSGGSKLKPSHELLKDPLMEPSGLRSNGAGNDVLRLPISSAVLGIQQISEFKFLAFETGAFSLVSSDRPTGPRFTTDLIKEMQCSEYHTDADLGKYILHITTSPQEGARLSWESNYLSVFQFGERVKGTLTVLFDECHESWNLQAYKRCIEALNIPRSKISYLRSWSPLWKAAQSQIKYALMNDKPSCDNNPAFEKEHISNKRHTLDLSLKPLPKISDEKDGSVTAKPRPVPRPIRKRSTSAQISNDNDTGETVEEVEPPHKRQRIDEPKNVRRSTRQQDKDKDKDKEKAKVDLDEVILVYPFGVPGAVNITVGDMNRLQPEEFLNDTLIEFGLKSWLKELEVENPELAAQVHVFNSFFYKKFNKRNVQEGYDSVRKWTSRIDIFSRKYIIVPINENLHWYLALIYEPEHILRTPSPSLQLVQTPSTRKQTRVETSTAETSTLHEEEITVEAETQVEAEVRPPSVCEDQPMDDDNNSEKEVEELAFAASCSVTIATDKSSAPDLKGLLSPEAPIAETEEPMDVDEKEVIDIVEDMDIINDGQEKSTKSESTIGSNRNSPIDITEDSQPTTLMSTITPSRFYGKSNGKLQKKTLVKEDDAIVIEEDAKEEPRTKIFIMDSLGNRHPQAMKQLGKWLQLEALDKKKVENITPPISKMALVPVQPNYCDCGLYTLHFAKTFLSNPQRYCDLIMMKERPSLTERQTDWKDASVREMRDELQHKILQYSEEWRQYRAARESEKTEEEDEDSDVAIVEHIKPPKKGRASKGTRTKG